MRSNPSSSMRPRSFALKYFALDKVPQLLEALNRNRKYIRMLMTPKLSMKYTPDIRFSIDTALDYAGKIDEILRKPEVQQDLKKDD